MLMLLWNFLFVLEEFTEIHQVRIVEEWGIKDLNINVLKEIILAFSLETEKKLQTKEPFHLFLSGFNTLIERINFIKIFDWLRHFKSLMTILIEEVWLEFGSVELIRKRVDFIDLLRLRLWFGFIWLAFHPTELKFYKKNIIFALIL